MKKFYEIGMYFSELNDEWEKIPVLLKTLWIAITIFLAMLGFGFIAFTIPNLLSPITSDFDPIVILASVPGALFALSVVVVSYVVICDFAKLIREAK